MTDFFFLLSLSKKTMPSKTTYEEGIECTPASLVRGLAGCFGFLLSVVVVTSLGVIAGGVFWTAQSMDKITDGDKSTYMMLRIH